MDWELTDLREEWRWGGEIIGVYLDFFFFAKVLVSPGFGPSDRHFFFTDPTRKLIFLHTDAKGTREVLCTPCGWRPDAPRNYFWRPVSEWAAANCTEIRVVTCLILLYTSGRPIFTHYIHWVFTFFVGILSPFYISVSWKKVFVNKKNTAIKIGCLISFHTDLISRGRMYEVVWNASGRMYAGNFPVYLEATFVSKNKNLYLSDKRPISLPPPLLALLWVWEQVVLSPSQTMQQGEDGVNIREGVGEKRTKEGRRQRPDLHPKRHRTWRV